ncbi:MAG: magnesium transporter [Thermoproteota archaeon]|nr:MAG: magnesium transporter [Candidatus Korarchaeota archaeon]
MEVLSFPDGFRKAFLLDVNEGIEEALKKLLLPDDLVSLIVRDIDRQRAIPQDGLTLILGGFRIKEGELEHSPLILLLREDYLAVISAGDFLKKIKEDFERNSYSCRSSPDLLMSVSLLRLVDEYYKIYDLIEDKIDELEDKVAENPSEVGIDEFRRVRNSLIRFRRALYSFREVASLMLGRGIYGISGDAERIVQEVYEDLIQLMDMVESQKERLADIRDLHLSALSLSLNEVMKKLTALNVIALPLIIIAGIYGMNLIIPEARWPYTYPVVLLVMFLMAAFSAFLLRRRGWI